MGGEEPDILLIQQMGDAVRGGAVVEQAPLLCGLSDPGIIVAVSVEDDALVLPDSLPEQLLQGGGEVLGPLQGEVRFRSVVSLLNLGRISTPSFILVRAAP